MHFYEEKDSGTVAFFWILRTFKEHSFCRASLLNVSIADWTLWKLISSITFDIGLQNIAFEVISSAKYNGAEHSNYLFHGEGPYYVETSSLICSKNQ